MNLMSKIVSSREQPRTAANNREQPRTTVTSKPLACVTPEGSSRSVCLQASAPANSCKQRVLAHAYGSAVANNREQKANKNLH